MRRGARALGAIVSLVLACGGTTTSSTPDASTTIKEPKRHRPVATACDATRPATAAPEPSASGCKTDLECTPEGGAAKNPRCVFDFLANKNVCSVDECTTDADCGASRVCACRLAPSFGANRCLNAGCTVDGDCGVVGKGFCSPSGDGVFANCPLPEPGALGYFCHGPADECTDDADCGGGNAFCLFSPAKSHFACRTLSCTK